jgi:hypothetical protein
MEYFIKEIDEYQFKKAIDEDEFNGLILQTIMN